MKKVSTVRSTFSSFPLRTTPFSFCRQSHYNSAEVVPFAVVDLVPLERKHHRHHRCRVPVLA
jgi:hypothetical protein